MEYRIHATRESVCAGDDFAGPEEKDLVYRSEDHLSSLMQDLGKYVPHLNDVVWSIRCGDIIIGYLYSVGANPYRYELVIEDELIPQLPSCNVFCKYYSTDAFIIRQFEKNEGITLPRQSYLKRVMAYEEQIRQNLHNHGIPYNE